MAPSDHSCTDARNLCIACRMFGMLHNRQVHKGQVSISDGELQDEKPQWKQVTILQGQPKKEHRSFYKHPVTGEWAKDMMKMYFHQPQNTHGVLPIPPKSKDAKGVQNKQMLTPQHTFSFTVHFENLEDDELDLLLYILALEDEVQANLKPEGLDPIKLQGPMLHKLGNAKGQGPGSCKISIEGLHISPDPEQRFSSLSQRLWSIFRDDELSHEIFRRTAKYMQDEDESETMQFVRKMMVWDENDSRVFCYPDYTWFNSEQNKETELKSI